MQTKVLYLIRGVPGSGKTTLGKQLIKGTDGVIFSADDYFTSSDGFYQFDPSRLYEAHRCCQLDCECAMITGLTPVVVANVFHKRLYMEPYIEYAKEHGYHVVEICVKSDFKNIHGCPEDKVKLFKETFEY